MAREIINIKTFDKGIYTAPDVKDVGDDVCVSSLNIDGSIDGKLAGIPSSSSVTITGSPNLAYASKTAWIKRDSGEYDLVYLDRNPATDVIRVATDFYGTPGNVDAVTSNVGSDVCFAVNNQEVHVGTGGASANTPKWIGHILHGQFGGSAPTGIQTLDAELVPQNGSVTGTYQSPTGIVFTEGTGTKYFVTTKRYYHGFSFVFDGYQESPLVFEQAGAVPSVDSEYLTLTVKAKGAETSPSSFNARVTAVNLYFAEGSSISTGNRGKFRLAKSIDINDAGWTVADTDDKDFSYNFYGYYTDESGVTYEANSGIPEEVTDTMVNYGLSCVANDFHIVGKCYKSDLPDAGLILFKSQQYRFDMFNWVEDLLRLPFLPTAMVSFNNRVYVFDRNNMATINVDGFYIEGDVTEGIGCFDSRSIVVTEYGMFWGDDKNVYWHDGARITNIGDRIRIASESGTQHWTKYDFNANPPVACYDRKGYVMFLIQDSAINYVWAYNIGRDRWDFWAGFGSTTMYSIFSGKFGESYTSVGTLGLYNNFGTVSSNVFTEGTNKRNWNAYSKKYDLEQPSLDKKFYYVTVDSTIPSGGSLTVQHNMDDAGFVAFSGSSPYLVPKTSDTYMAKIGQLSFVCSGSYTGGIEVDSISWSYRRLHNK